MRVVAQSLPGLSHTSVSLKPATHCPRPFTRCTFASSKPRRRRYQRDERPWSQAEEIPRWKEKKTAEVPISKGTFCLLELFIISILIATLRLVVVHHWWPCCEENYRRSAEFELFWGQINARLSDGKTWAKETNSKTLNSCWYVLERNCKILCNVTCLFTEASSW